MPPVTATDAVPADDVARRRRRAELLEAYRNAENADECERIRAEIARLDDAARASWSRPRMPREDRDQARRVLGVDRKTIAAGERERC